MCKISLKRGISVVICCYNSAWIIERTLDALKKQIIRKGLSWEIVLVDNNCSDETVSVAQKTMEGCNIPFQIVEEKESGLANARKKGIISVSYDVVLYCDDDNLLCPDYIDTMYGIMRSDQNIGATGGKGIAEYQVEPDPIVKANPGCYAVGSQKEHDCWLFGAGLTLRTELVREVYQHQKCYLMGRQGKKLLSGDDSELVMSMVVRGYKIAPTDDVYYIHVLKADRLNEDYFEKLYQGLVLPQPVFEVFRSVIDGKPFKLILDKYFNFWKSRIWGVMFWWKEGAKEARTYGRKRIQKYNYWGLLRLWRIYVSWKKIKKNAELSRHLS